MYLLQLRNSEITVIGVCTIIIHDTGGDERIRMGSCVGKNHAACADRGAEGRVRRAGLQEQKNNNETNPRQDEPPF